MPLMQFVTTILVPVLIGVCSSVVATYLSLRRFYSEKWWEKKNEAYMAVLASLIRMLKIEEDELKRYSSQIEMPRDEEKALGRESKLEREKLEQQIRLGAFGISSEALAQLEHLIKNLGRNPED